MYLNKQVLKTKSSLPKVLHKVGGKTLLERVLESALCLNPEKCILLAEEVEEMSSMNQDKIEQEIRDLENENSDESKQQYFVAKSKIEALNSSHYKKI